MGQRVPDREQASQFKCHQPGESIETGRWSEAMTGPTAWGCGFSKNMKFQEGSEEDLKDVCFPSAVKRRLNMTTTWFQMPYWSWPCCSWSKAETKRPSNSLILPSKAWSTPILSVFPQNWGVQKLAEVQAAVRLQSWYKDPSLLISRTNGPEGMTVVVDDTTRAQLFISNPFNVLKAQFSDYVWMRVVMVVVSHLISQNGQASCVWSFAPL